MTSTAETGSVADAAAVYGVAESTIRLWIRDGKLPARRVGQRRYEVDLTAPDDPHIAFTRALHAITPDDLRALSRLAARLDGAVGGSSLLFGHAWTAIGVEARRHVQTGATR